jgi:hypothetical protein
MDGSCVPISTLVFVRQMGWTSGASSVFGRPLSSCKAAQEASDRWLAGQAMALLFSCSTS